MNPHSHSFLLISLFLMLLCFSKLLYKTEASPFSARGLQVPATNITVEFLDPTLPPAISPAQTPKCSLIVFQHDFATAAAGIGSVPVASANYTQPADCPAPWVRVVLELSMSVVSGDVHKDRVASVWINDGEVLRTSIPSPNLVNGFWKVHKDVTRYTALLRRRQGRGTIIMTLEENSVAATDSGDGVYTANVSLHFFRGPLSAFGLPVDISYVSAPSVKGIYRQPADLIVPVTMAGDNGFWLNVTRTSPVPTASVSIPRNTYRAVLEIFASNHADDELWYMNPLKSPCIIGAAGESNANGGLRQIYATIDGRFVGGHIPFAVIYSGSINPYFWWPVSSIGAFDMPSYSLELTPLLELLIDGKPHEVGFGVKNGLDYWLLSSNLHLWVDRWSDVVQAGIVDYRAPPLTVTQQAEWHNQDGGSEVNAEGLLRFIGWVSSSGGNVTTTVRQKVTFKSQVEVQNRGAVRQVEMINKERMAIGMRSGHDIVGRVQIFVEAPLQIQTVVVRVGGGGPAAVYEERTRLFHQLDEMLNLNDRMVVSTSMMTDRQDAEGTAMTGGDGTAVWGSGSTKSAYKYRDEGTCYLRRVNADGGMVKMDDTSPSCAAVADQ